MHKCNENKSGTDVRSSGTWMGDGELASPCDDEKEPESNNKTNKTRKTQTKQTKQRNKPENKVEVEV